MINKKSSLKKSYELSCRSNTSIVHKKDAIDLGKIEDVEFFKPVEGRNSINIIPYEIRTLKHPLVNAGEMEIGNIDFVLDIYTHRNVGVNSSSVICLKKTYGKPCPICEQARVLWKEGKEEEARSLFPSRRAYYNVQDLSEPDKLKIFETSFSLFQKELGDEARDSSTNEFVDFADLEDGKVVNFRAVKDKFKNNEFFRFKSFSFTDRKESIPDELVNNAISFDELINVPTYDEVKSLFYGENENQDIDELDNCELAEYKTSTLNESKTNESNEEKVKIGGGCKFGHTFGNDCDKFEDCDDCDDWDKCIKFKG